MSSSTQATAVVYLARGAESNWMTSVSTFAKTYLRFRPGLEHSLHVIYKGFVDKGTLQQARDAFRHINHVPLMLDDDSYDIGAYIAWVSQIDEEVICAMGTASEVMCDQWLAKLSVNLHLPGVGLVGATGSYESLREMSDDFPAFPNPHLRSNAFMLNSALFREITKQITVKSKLDAYRFESGAASMTRQVLAKGLEVLLVGRNGRGYSLENWPVSGTFRQGEQGNLLVADNQTRSFRASPWADKQVLVSRTWGPYIQPFEILPAASILRPGDVRARFRSAQGGNV